jgi:hypothetical protein
MSQGKDTDEKKEVEEDLPPAGAKETGSGGRRTSDSTSYLIGILFYLVIGVIIVWSSTKLQALLLRNIWPLGIIGGLIVVVLVFIWLRRGVLGASIKKQIGLITFVAIPILLALVGAVTFIKDEYEIAVLRSVFLLIVSLLPALMYYLFIASRKTSLLQEFFTNLARLGLLERQEQNNESGNGRLEQRAELEREVRILTYIQKFESVYGPIPDDVAGDILEATNPDNPKPEVPEFHRYSAGGVTGIFTPETSIPVVMATVLIGLGWLLTLPVMETGGIAANAPTLAKWKAVLKPNDSPVLFAFLGAYFFSLQMLFRRYVRKDLRASAFVAVSLRVILAVIGTWAVLEAASILEFKAPQTKNAKLVLGFVIGAFPPIAWQVIQAAFQKITLANFFVPSMRSTMPVSDLDGLTVWHQARLEEEDIENVPNMATADLVELMLNTRFPPNRIVDWVDQAILYTQLGPDMKLNGKPSEKVDEKANGAAAQNTSRQLLREHGIRTASALVYAYEKSKAPNGQDNKNLANDAPDFDSILPSQRYSRIHTLVDTLSTNPNLKLVQRWRRVNQLGENSSLVTDKD